MLDLKQAQEWVVTTKLGASDKRPGTEVCLLIVPRLSFDVTVYGICMSGPSI